MKKWLRNLEVGIEEVILLVIIILNFFDAFEILGSDLDFAKKIISWAALGLLFYKVKLSKLFVGRDDARLDLMLVFGYFLLTIKNLVSYAFVEFEETSLFLEDFYAAIVHNAFLIESIGIYIGLAVLFFVSLRLAFVSIKRPSIMSVFHASESKPSSVKEYVVRFLSVFAIVFGFFIVFFNLTMEWLAIAIDAPLLMIGLGLYIILVLQHRASFSQVGFLTKFGDFGSKLYEDVLKHIQFRKTFFRTIAAMIVLHVITDAFTFVWPYLFGFGDKLYLALLSAPHPSFMSLLSVQLLHLPLFEAISLVVIYLGNVIALLFFLVYPFYTWFVLYKNKTIHPSRLQISVLVSSITLFLLSPTFRIIPLLNQQLFGVDIIGQYANSSYIFSTVVLCSLALGIFVELYSKHIEHERFVIFGLIIVSQVFLFCYMAMYLFSVSTFYFSILPTLFFKSKIILLLFFALLFIGSLLFYVIGVGSFIKDSVLHFTQHIKLDGKKK